MAESTEDLAAEYDVTFWSTHNGFDTDLDFRVSTEDDCGGGAGDG